MPAINGSFAQARLRHAGDQLRTAWARARLASLETGQTHAWRCVWGSSQFEVRPLALVEQEPDNAPSSPAEEDPTGQDIIAARLAGDRLVADIVFAEGRWNDVETKDAAGQWSEPILFYPDGTTSDAVIVLSGNRPERLQVILRGLTGVSRAGSERPSDE